VSQFRGEKVNQNTHMHTSDSQRTLPPCTLPTQSDSLVCAGQEQNPRWDTVTIYKLCFI